MFLPIRFPRFVFCVLRWAALVAVLAAIAATVPAAVMDPADYTAAAPAAAERHPAAAAAEEAFFGSLVHGALPAGEVLPPLLGAYAAAPDDPRTSLLLGTHYLRLAAMGQGSDPHAIAHLMLAERFLERAGRLAPDDDRIASFLVPTQLALASIERAGEARQRELMAGLMRAYEADPAFNSFTVAMIGYQSPRDSQLFTLGIEALRAVQENGCAEGDATCDNAPRWPHAVEGYLAFFADYELKAGERQRARLLLEEVRGVPGFADWPYRELVDERLASFDEHARRFADDDETNDPPTAVLARGCAACHRSG